jgi:hypothetical protein
MAARRITNGPARSQSGGRWGRAGPLRVGLVWDLAPHRPAYIYISHVSIKTEVLPTKSSLF